MQPQLFTPQQVPRRRRRVMMRVVDAGIADCNSHLGQHVVHLKCGKCGHDAGWLHVATVSEGKRGLPCPKCNEGQPS